MIIQEGQERSSLFEFHISVRQLPLKFTKLHFPTVIVSLKSETKTKKKKKKKKPNLDLIKSN